MGHLRLNVVLFYPTYHHHIHRIDAMPETDETQNFRGYFVRSSQGMLWVKLAAAV